VKKFRRHGSVISTQLSGYEISLLASLLNQLVELVRADDSRANLVEPESADPFVMWAQELAEPASTQLPDDPALRRLLPDAYPGDAAASADFRRFTDQSQRAKKIADARQVLAALPAPVHGDEGLYPLRIAADDVDAWLRTLTSLRLTVGTRLGITDAHAAEELAGLSESDPRAFMMSVYDWLGFAQETMLGAL
jgi:hypothetical protein